MRRAWEVSAASSSGEHAPSTQEWRMPYTDTPAAAASASLRACACTRVATSHGMLARGAVMMHAWSRWEEGLRRNILELGLG